MDEDYKSQLKASHQLGKGMATELHSLKSMTDTWFKFIINNMTTEALKVSNLEKSCGDLKRKVGTLDSTISTLKEQHVKIIDLLQEQVTDHKQTNAKINVLYFNRYGDAPSSSVPSGLTTEASITRNFDAHSATIETAKSIRDLQVSVSSLFSAHAIITNDVKLMSEAYTRTREDMNLLLSNQQHIIGCSQATHTCDQHSFHQCCCSSCYFN